eukprot:7155-Lingulodinium_polyedra.AAC.1
MTTKSPPAAMPRLRWGCRRALHRKPRRRLASPAAPRSSAAKVCRAWNLSFSPALSRSSTKTARSR